MVKRFRIYFFPFSKIKYPEVDNQPVAYLLKVIKGSLLAHIFAFKSENNCWASWFASLFRQEKCTMNKSPKGQRKSAFILRNFFFLSGKKNYFLKNFSYSPFSSGWYMTPTYSHSGVWESVCQLPICGSPCAVHLTQSEGLKQHLGHKCSTWPWVFFQHPSLASGMCV